MKFFLDIIGSFLAACFVAIFLLGWWLYDGPRPVSFLNSYFEETLNRGGNRIVLGQTMLSWVGWQRALDFRLHNVKVMGPEGEIVATIPEMAVGLNFLALLKGELALNEVAFFSPDLVATIDQGGGFNFDFPGIAHHEQRIHLDHLLVTELYSYFESPALESPALETLAVYDARILIKDKHHDLAWLLEQATLNFSLVDHTLIGDVSAHLSFNSLPLEDGSPAALWSDLADSGQGMAIGHIRSFLRYDLGTKRIDMDGHIDGVRTDSLARLGADWEFLQSLNVTLSGEISLTIDRDDDPQITFYARAQGGYFNIGSDQITIDDLSLHGRLAPENILIDQFAVTSGESELSGSAVVGSDDQGISTRGHAVLHHLPAAYLGRYWPPQASDFAKTWLTENLNIGLLTKADTVFSFFVPTKAGAKPQVTLFHGSLEFEDVTVAFLNAMPPVTDVQGGGFFSKDQVNLIIGEGQVDGMTTDGAVVSLTRLNTDFEYAYIEAGTYGRLPELLRILDHDPVRAAEFLGIDPATTQGSAVARGVFNFPMTRDLGIDQVEIAATIDLRDVFLTQMVADHAFEDGVLFLHVDKEKFIVEGSGDVKDVEVKLSGTQYFSDSASFAARYAITATVEGDAWQRFGLTLDPFVSGPVAVDLIWTLINAQEANMALAADLSNATLRLSAFDWIKEAGIPGTAQFTFSLKEDGSPIMDSFSVITDGLQAAGYGRANPESGAWERMMVSPLRFGRSDLEAEIIFADPPLIQIYGQSLDLDPFFNRDAYDSYDEDIPDFLVDMRVDTLWTGENAKIDNVLGNLEHRDGLWRSVYLSNAGDPGHKIRLRVSSNPDSPGRYLRLFAENAGDFLRSFGLYSHMIGGTLLLEGRIDDRDHRNSITGEMDITDFEISESPVFARLLSLPSLDGLVERLGGGGLGFRKLVAPFQLVDQSLKIDQGRGFGSLGLTFAGIFDLENDSIDMAGSIVPSYALNSIWGGIPIIGDLLTGREEGGGIFAFTYRVLGNWARPRVTINPLSALTPGIFRELMTLFEGQKPETSFFPQDEPPQNDQSFP